MNKAEKKLCVHCRRYSHDTKYDRCFACSEARTQHAALRRHVATHVLAGMCANPQFAETKDTLLAVAAVELADTLIDTLLEREKED